MRAPTRSSRDRGRRGGTEDVDGAEARTARITRRTRTAQRRGRRGGARTAAPASLESSGKGVRSSGGDRWLDGGMVPKGRLAARRRQQLRHGVACSQKRRKREENGRSRRLHSSNEFWS
ncbi:hypothetical protein Scep_027589 [Stephania cephalantha]|uniref:Uncharacterized protein n=1 Tax=Stephania cephalantha TaxID=152367 RepID=A0AAP0EBN3_9MAGN